MRYKMGKNKQTYLWNFQTWACHPAQKEWPLPDRLEPQKGEGKEESWTVRSWGRHCLIQLHEETIIIISILLVRKLKLRETRDPIWAGLTAKPYLPLIQYLFLERVKTLINASGQNSYLTSYSVCCHHPVTPSQRKYPCAFFLKKASIGCHISVIA
jgi:hypothetical protein